MKLPALLTSDLHLVAEPACDYRWKLFPWLREQAKLEKAKTICILGDLVDRKDNHPAVLVNRIADEIKRTQQETGCEIVVLAGNHDWLKEGEEFFRFLRHLEGVEYIAGDAWEHPDVKGPLALFLPYTKSPMTAWKGLSFEHYDYVFMHQTIRGSKASTGMVLEGDNLPDLGAARKVYSGDIHVPQVVKNPLIGHVEYVGSPYHVHFGDNFKARVVLLETNGRPVDLHVPGMPRRVTLRMQSMKELQSYRLDEGDQVKVRLELKPEDRHQWARMRRDVLSWLMSRGMQVHGIELVAIGGDGKRITHNRAHRLSGMPADEALERYVREEELGGDAFETGMKLL